MLGCVCLAGCGSVPHGYDSPDPAERFGAAVAGARTNDPRAIPELIRLLGSDDPAIRLASSHELQKVTGQNMGYNHADPEPRRRQAIERWVRWYESAASSPGSQPEPANSDRRTADSGARGR
jgi:hypothetical protein